MIKIVHYRSKRFYKNIFWIRICKDCGVEYRPPLSSFQAVSRRCYVCRKKWNKEYNKKQGINAKIRYKNLTPEQKNKIYQKGKLYNLKWILDHLERRRIIALKSYHKNKKKPSNKKRRHIATKKFPASATTTLL